MACDVASEPSVQKVFENIQTTFGRIDAVVASAGIVENFAALDYPADRMKRLYDINVHGAFYTAREAARLMIPRGSGSIILIASMSASIVNIPQFQMPYNASKAAVKHMGATLGVEWAKSGVRVNTLSPGYILTKLTRTILANDPHDLNLKVRYLAIAISGDLYPSRKLGKDSHQWVVWVNPRNYLVPSCSSPLTLHAS